MQIFINELSLHEQFNDKSQFVKALKVFLSIFLYINKLQREKQIFTSNELTIYKAVREELFVKSLNSVPDKSLSQAVKNTLFNKLNAKDWQPERVHSSDDWYQHNEDIVTDTSIAELSERKIQNSHLLTGILINFQESVFSDKITLEVVKNENIRINVDCAENKSCFEKWIENNFKLSSVTYDYSSHTPPTDKQTILRDSDRFQPTSAVFQGRKVYKEFKTDYYWYIDNLHYGEKAHLEVFNSQGKHIGEASLEGKTDIAKADKNKKINVR